MATAAYSECVVFISRASPTVCFPADLLSSAWGATNSRKEAGTQETKGTKTYASGGKCGGNKKTVDAAAALGLGVPHDQQNTTLAGVAGLGVAQHTPLDSPFGSIGTNTMTGLGGFGTGLQSANSGNDLLQLAALCQHNDTLGE